MSYAQILVVEDEAIVAKDVSNRLRQMGYSVSETASTGEDAIERTKTTRPDLVLMDIHLKGNLDGIDTATQIRRQHDVPIIYLTAYADDDTVARAQLTEPAGYLLKPFVERELQTTIEMALYKHRNERRLHAREQWFANTLRSMCHGVIATDENGRVTFMNATAENLAGITFSSSLGKLLVDLFQLEDSQSHTLVKHPALKVLHDGEDVDRSVHSLLRKSGCGQVPIEYTAGAIRDNTGAVTGMVMVFAEAARPAESVGGQAASQRRTIAAFDAALDCLFILDKEGRVIETNATARRILRWDTAALNGKVMADLILAPSWRVWLRRELAYYITTGQGPCLDRRIELSALRADGTEFPAELVIRLLDLPGPPLFAVFLRDITDRKRDEQKLDNHIRALQETVAKIRPLSGILPICSTCKKIRDQTGTWVPVEHYIHKHAGVQFSHGYCPDCGANVMDKFRQYLGDPPPTPLVTGE